MNEKIAFGKELTVSGEVVGIKKIWNPKIIGWRYHIIPVFIQHWNKLFVKLDECEVSEINKVNKPTTSERSFDFPSLASPKVPMDDPRGVIGNKVYIKFIMYDTFSQFFRGMPSITMTEFNLAG